MTLTFGRPIFVAAFAAALAPFTIQFPVKYPGFKASNPNLASAERSYTFCCPIVEATALPNGCPVIAFNVSSIAIPPSIDAAVCPIAFCVTGFANTALATGAAVIPKVVPPSIARLS